MSVYLHHELMKNTIWRLFSVITLCFFGLFGRITLCATSVLMHSIESVVSNPEYKRICIYGGGGRRTDL